MLAILGTNVHEQLPGVVNMSNKEFQCVPVVWQACSRDGATQIANFTLRPFVPVLIGALVDPDTPNYRSEESISIENTTLGHSVLLDNSDVQHETLYRQIGQPLANTVGNSVATRSGILFYRITTLSVPNQFYNMPLELQVSLRQDTKQGKPFNQRQVSDNEELNLRLLMDLNRYRPQAAKEHVVSQPVQFVQPLSVEVQVRELTHEESILSLRVRNTTQESMVCVREVVFHHDRTVAHTLPGVTSAPSFEWNAAQTYGNLFQVTPLNAQDGSAHCISPDEEVNIVYRVSIRENITATEALGVSGMRFSVPCTVYYKLEPVGPTRAETAPSDQQRDDAVLQTLPELATAVRRILAEAESESSLGKGFAELDCTATWTVGSTFTSIARPASASNAVGWVEAVLTGPAMVRAGEEVLLRVCLTNTGSADLERLVLCALSRYCALCVRCICHWQRNLTTIEIVVAGRHSNHHGSDPVVHREAAYVVSEAETLLG